MYNAVFEDSFFSAAMLQFMEHQGEDEFFSRPFFSRFAIPAKCRIEILRRCEESNRKVAKELLGREDGVLFREPWPRPDETHQSYGGLTTEKLVPIFLHMLQKQHGAIQEQHNRIRELERLVKQLNFAGVIRAVLRKMKRRITSLVTLGRNGANEEWQEKLDASVRPQDLSPRSSDAGQNGTCREKPHFGASTGSVAAGSH
jgi:hypothetical protein